MNDSATHKTIYLCNECADLEYIDPASLLPFTAPPVREELRHPYPTLWFQCQACGRKLGGWRDEGQIDLGGMIDDSEPSGQSFIEE